MSHAAFELLQATGRLPSPTEAAFNIIRVARDPNATISSISAVVETDPATAARILRHVNSSFAGVANKVSSLPQAITLLGLRAVVGLALGYSLVSKHRGGKCENFDYEGFWSDSLARAVTVRHLSPKHGLLPGETFTCGLLSKIGRLALATIFPKEYAEVLRRADEDEEHSLLELESGIFEIDHDSLTAEMMADWGLPPYFGEAARAQSNPDNFGLTPGSRARQVCYLLHLCEQLGPIFRKQNLHRRRLNFLVNAVDRALITPERFMETFATISREWQSMGEMLTVRTSPALPWERLYKDASEFGWVRPRAEQVDFQG